jgi:cytidylate kinase
MVRQLVSKSLVKRILITISGPAGSGKSHCASKLAELYGIQYYSAGSIFRKMALEKGVSLEEFSKMAAKDPEIDREIDRCTSDLAKKSGLILEGRLVSFFSATSLPKISFYLTAPFEERIRRIAKREGISLKESEAITRIREEEEYKRYQFIYGLDVNDLSGYDFVINTSLWDIKSIVTVLKTIVEVYLKTHIQLG